MDNVLGWCVPLSISHSFKWGLEGAISYGCFYLLYTAFCSISLYSRNQTPSGDLVKAHQFHQLSFLWSISLAVHLGISGIFFMRGTWNLKHSTGIGPHSLQFLKQVPAADPFLITQEFHVQAKAFCAWKTLQNLQDTVSMVDVSIFSKHSQEFTQETKTKVSLENQTQILRSELKQELVALLVSFHASTPVSIELCRGLRQPLQLLEDKHNVTGPNPCYLTTLDQDSSFIAGKGSLHRVHSISWWSSLILPKKSQILSPNFTTMVSKLRFNYNFKNVFKIRKYRKYCFQDAQIL